ncbi:MAG: META domain-containing protein [Anaerolineales bacterium]|jgi:heat shock protein HslJ|nr:META domain-containing protein [Anaerolineales bacterium]
MKTRNITLFAILILALGLTACGASSVTDLKGTSWNLVEIAGQPVLADATPTLVFEDGQAGGNGSCNTFGGEYQQSGNSLTFGTMISTLMYCEGFSDQETAYLTALSESATYQIKADRLTIFNAAGEEILAFEQAK